MPEGRPSISPISSSRVATGDVAHHAFTVVRRGYDTDEVRSYLQAVARDIAELDQRQEELRAAAAEADERAAHPVIDEATLTASLGQHSAQLLRHAHDEAARIVAQAQESSSTLLREAQSQVNEIQAQAEGHTAERVAEAELMVATAEQEARVEATRIHADAMAEADEMIARAKDEGRALLEQVQAARKRVLADMSTRRRALSIQIEQLRAARDEMAASIHGVRDSVDGILTDLQRSDEDARSAAAAAGDGARLRGIDDEPLSDELAGGPVTAGPFDGRTEEAAPTDAAPRPGAVGEGPSSGGQTTEDPTTEETPPVPPGVLSEEDSHDAVPVGDAPSVDELFARIRAGTGTEVPAVVQEPAPSTPAAPAPEPSKPAAPAAPAAAPPAPAKGSPEATTQVVAPESEVVEVTEGTEVSDGPDQALIGRRNELISPITVQLSRHIKRALGDDQNRLLDVLRVAPTTEGEALLGPEDAHLATFTAAAAGHLAEAFTAGTKFAGGKAAKGPTEAAAEKSATGLARSVVTMVRRRIEEGTDAGEDVSARVGAAYREWRGERIERLVGDCALQSFSAGVLAAVTKKGTVRWVLTSTDGCSDCDDNALAGVVTVAEGFPTGHAGPPAHAGCRCLVAPTSA
jgi:DivIVA domain-containing protein